MIDVGDKVRKYKDGLMMDRKEFLCEGCFTVLLCVKCLTRSWNRCESDKW